MEEGTRLYLMAPIVRVEKGSTVETLDLQKRGFQRVKIDGEIYEINEAPTLKKNFKHDIDVVVDRLVLRKRLIRDWLTLLKQHLNLLME